MSWTNLQILKSAYKLLNYTEVKNPIYIGPELSREDLIKEREVLKLRRELITQGPDRKELRVRNLTLQERVENEQIPDEQKRVYQTDAWLESASENPDKSLISRLLFNVRSVLDIERRMALSNALISSNYDILCLTETWLTSHVPDEAVFLKEFELHRADRHSVAKTKHGGVLIAVKHKLNHSRCKINFAHDGFICVSIDLAGTVLQICCIYYKTGACKTEWYWMQRRAHCFCSKGTWKLIYSELNYQS